MTNDNLNKDEYILVEIRGLYDGFLAKYYPEEHRIEWRDHYVVDRFSDERKQELEKQILEGFSE